MTVSLVGIVVAIVVILLLIWAVQYLTKAFNTPPQIAAVIYVILVVIAVLILLGAVTGFPTSIKIGN